MPSPDLEEKIRNLRVELSGWSKAVMSAPSDKDKKAAEAKYQETKGKLDAAIAQAGGPSVV